MNVWWLTTCDFDLNPLYRGILFRRNTGLSERNFARDGNVKFEPEIKSRTLLWCTRSPLVHRVRLHLRGSSTQTAVKFFFMVTARAKGGSNFLAAQINQRNCEHDNYHPMARSSVNTPSSPRRLPSTALITKNSFGLPVLGRPDTAFSMLMMFPKSRAFINNKSEQSALVAKYASSRIK